VPAIVVGAGLFILSAVDRAVPTLSETAPPVGLIAPADGPAVT